MRKGQKIDKTKFALVLARLDRPAWEQLVKIAKGRYMSVTGLIRLLVDREIARDKAEKAATQA